jgi:hypothetical protein
MVRRTLDQIDAHAIPENHPAAARLHDLFGDHTFFLDRKGLNIVEPIDENGSVRPSAQVISLADWKDEDQTALEAHDPEPTDLFIDLDAEGPMDGARVKRMKM